MVDDRSARAAPAVSSCSIWHASPASPKRRCPGWSSRASSCGQGQAPNCNGVRSATPEHPYTQRLLLASPVPDPVTQEQRRAQRYRLLAQQAESDEQAGAVVGASADGAGSSVGTH